MLWSCYGSDWFGLLAQQIASIRSIAIPLKCHGWDPACVALDWLVAWGLMELRKKDILTSFKRPKWPIRQQDITS